MHYEGAKCKVFFIPFPVAFSVIIINFAQTLGFVHTPTALGNNDLVEMIKWRMDTRTHCKLRMFQNVLPEFFISSIWRALLGENFFTLHCSEVKHQDISTRVGPEVFINDKDTFHTVCVQLIQNGKTQHHNPLITKEFLLGQCVWGWSSTMCLIILPWWNLDTYSTACQSIYSEVDVFFLFGWSLERVVKELVSARLYDEVRLFSKSGLMSFMTQFVPSVPCRYTVERDYISLHGNVFEASMNK